MQITDYTTLKERLYHETMPNGLNVYLLKKKDSLKHMAYLQRALEAWIQALFL